MELKKLSTEVSEIIRYSKEYTIKMGNNVVSPDHFFLGIIRHKDNDAYRLLKELDIDVNEYKCLIESQLHTSDQSSQALNMAITGSGNLFLTKAADIVFRKMQLEVRSMKETEIKAIHMLLAILSEGTSVASKQLNRDSIDYDLIKKHLSEEKAFDVNNGDYDNDDDDDDDAIIIPPKTHTISRNTGTLAIDNFSTDLTKIAADNKLDPIVGREREIERLAQILSR
ncbi:MAG: hypothetical protein LBD76_08540, partial [Prevotellaceae bacterium]|nr:hypothetical protein [Prevotellaceae bacterium]